MNVKALVLSTLVAFSATGALAQGVPSNPTPGSPSDEQGYTTGKSDGGGWGAASGAGSGEPRAAPELREPFPSAQDCEDGWHPGMPWSRTRFETLCDQR